MAAFARLSENRARGGGSGDFHELRALDVEGHEVASGGATGRTKSGRERDHSKLIGLFQGLLIVSNLLLLGGVYALLTSAKRETAAATLLDAKGTLTVGTPADYRPYSFVEGDGEGARAGIDIELVSELAKGLRATEVRFVNTTWAGLTDGLEGGKYDLAVGGISVTLGRMLTGAFSESYYETGKVAIAECGSQGDAAGDIESLKQLVVGVNVGKSFTLFLRHALS